MKWCVAHLVRHFRVRTLGDQQLKDLFGVITTRDAVQPVGTAVTNQCAIGAKFKQKLDHGERVLPTTNGNVKILARITFDILIRAEFECASDIGQVVSPNQFGQKSLSNLIARPCGP